MPDGHVLPPDAVIDGLQRHAGSDSVTWLGHASFLIRLDGRTILTDPFLSDHASPLPPFGPETLRAARSHPGRGCRRSTSCCCRTTITTIWICRPSRLCPRRERIQVLVPLRLGHYFTARGFAHVRELDWHDEVEAAGIKVTGTARDPFLQAHAVRSQRDAVGRLRRAEHAQAHPLRRRYRLRSDLPGARPQRRPFDLSLVPIGAYEPRLLMQAVHVNPEEAVRLARELHARRVVGMHWGTIQLTDEPPFEPPERFRRAAHDAGYADDDVWVMRIGETRAI